MPSDANVIILLPTPWLEKGSWIEKVYEELLYTGVLANVAKVTGVDVDEDFVFDVIMWRCTKYNENRCPAVISTLDNKVLLLKITPFADKNFIEIYDFEKVLIEEIRGLGRHA